MKIIKNMLTYILTSVDFWTWLLIATLTFGFGFQALSILSDASEQSKQSKQKTKEALATEYHVYCEAPSGKVLFDGITTNVVRNPNYVDTAAGTFYGSCSIKK